MANCVSMAQPGYSAFWSSYSGNISTAASGTNVPESAIASQWYQEWGIPINNPANQTSTMGVCNNGNCYGSFPNFCSLADGVQAYIDQVNYSYNGGANAWPSHVYSGVTINWAGAYNTGFTGGLTGSAQQDSGGTATSTSLQTYGMNNLPDPPSPQQMQYYNEQGAKSVMQMMGASPWDAGHYWSSGDTYVGESLINVATNSGWLANDSII